MTTLLNKLNTLIGDTQIANDVFSLVNKPTAQRKYIESAAGKLAKKKANETYKAKQKPHDDAVKNHVLAWREEFAKDSVIYNIHTNLWDHYQNSCAALGHQKMTRKTYKEGLDKLQLVQVCPHVREGKTYYVLGYEFEKI